MPQAGYTDLVSSPNETASIKDLEARNRRLELGRKAFKEFYAQCFWSSDPSHVVEEADLPWVIRNLRAHGGHRGYRRAAELCQ